jgi:putative hemolysin
VANVDFNAVLPQLIPAGFPRALRPFAARALGLTGIGETYAALASETGAITDRLLRHMQVTTRISDRDHDRIPREGPVVVVANHPFGILEGAVLATLLKSIRPDVRFLANGILAMIPDLADLIIAVDPINGGAAQGNRSGMRRALRHLKSGGMLVVFPAGEVSHFNWRDRTSADPPWNPAITRLADLASAAMLPMYIEGSNSPLFHVAGMVHPRLRTALLARELLNKRGATVRLRVGKAIEPVRVRAMSSNEERIDYLRWRTYLLASRPDFKAQTQVPLLKRTSRASRKEPVVAVVSTELLSREVAALRPELESGDLSVYVTESAAIPNLLIEIGRLREITFRHVGEGTGRAIDLDRFDQHYLHLFVWNSRKREVVGAYRLGGTDRVGLNGLYTATLFQFGAEFLQTIGTALELGRSWIRPEYQKGFAPLLLLWKGIGKFVARNPRYRVLFGPVSISNQYQSISRELMVSFLERTAPFKGCAGLVQARHAPSASRTAMFCADIDELSEIVADIEPESNGVPVLLRQYLRLGGKLLGFNVDPDFSNALDGLILVDLTLTEPKLLERYLGKSEAATFLAFQKGNHVTFEDVPHH